MKKVLSFLLILAMLCGILPLDTFAADAMTRSYRWELENDTLVSNVTNGNIENVLTMTGGSITDGKFSKVTYTLGQAVTLKHDQPWVMEWRSSGTWTDTTDGALLFAGSASSTAENTPYLYRRHNSDFIALGMRTGGQYHNYGVALGANGIDGTIPHTYRLENRISADGANMVYLWVDNREIAPMNHHWVGGTDQKESVDWLNGRDLVFTHMGTTPHTIGNCCLDHIQIWENGHNHGYQATVTAPGCIKQGYTTYTCTCGDSYVADHTEPAGHRYADGICAVCGDKKTEPKKRISILGDSISTYANYSNGTAAETSNSTIKNGAVYYPRSGFDVTAESTWWYQAARELDMEILVNNSWSGSCLLNPRSGTVGAYVDRCVQLHDDTGDNAGQEPDLIAVFLGTNDYYTYPGTLGSYESIGFDTLITKTESGYVYAAPATSMEAYAIILHKIGQCYPDAQVYCFTLLPSVNSSSQPTAVNQDIRQLADHFGAVTVDLYHCGVQAGSTHMGDNLHPNSAGMDAMTNAFVSAVLKNSGETTYDVQFELNDVVALEGTARTVISGKALTVTLKGKTDARYLNVRVSMGGVDITQACYADGIVHIPAVTGDVEISASQSERDPLHFHWKYDAQKNALVSTSSNGNTENALTMTGGSITGGKFSKVTYTLGQAVILKHDRPWIMEWRSSGTWTDTTDGALLFAGSASSTAENTPYLYRRHNSDFIALGMRTGGQYHNYGVALGANGIDGTIPHTYRLENRISADGANMVYLWVDNREIAPMNHHWVGGTDQKETVDWLNGRDLVFTHMGTTPHTIGNCYLDHIQIWENGHNHCYAAGVCTLCGGEDPNPFAGKTIACIGDSITAGVGVTKDQTDYVTLLSKALDMDYIRLGASGTTLCTDGHAACNVKKLTEANLAGADVVTVLMGINDFVQARNQYYRLGTVDSTDTSTIYGAVHMWCQKIQELRHTDALKNTQFYFMTPVITSWNNSVSSVRNWNQDKTNLHGYTLRDLCNAIIEVCAQYEIPVIDLNLISGLYYNSAEDNNITKFGGDGAHPGTVGHQMMADAIKNALLQNHLRNDHDHSYGSWITTTYPNCKDGEQQRLCAVCTATERETLEGRGHHYENGTCNHCGDLQPDPLKFSGASLTLEDNLTINFKVLPEMIQQNGYENVYAVFRFGSKTVTVSDYTLSGDRYVFSFKDIIPQRMDDDVYATLYATRNGVTCISDTVAYSVTAYCYKMLGSSTAQNNDKLKTLLVDLLNYGSAAQAYANYNTDSLANSRLTETQKSWATGELRQLDNLLNTAYQTVANPTVTWKSAGLRLDNAVTIRVKLAAQSIDGLSVKVTGANMREITVTGDEFVETDGGYYVYIRGLHAAQMSETVYLTVYEGSTPVSNTLRYSIESYVWKYRTSTENHLGEMLTAMMKYGDAARAYRG